MSDPVVDAAPSGLPGFLRSLVHHLPGDNGALPVEGPLPAFAGATSWLNAEPLTPEGLRGRVVLVDFWTYTCVNWLRTLPYVRAWDAKYASPGADHDRRPHPGVRLRARPRQHHHPGPRAERALPDRRRQRLRRLERLRQPLLAGRLPRRWQGRIRYHHFGEGEYAMTEMVIQQLLLEAGATNVDPDLVSVDPVGLEVAADYQTLRSPETYLGYGQATGMAVAGRPPRRCGARLRRRHPACGSTSGRRRGLVDLTAGRHGDGGERPARVPLPGPRCQPGDGTGSTRDRDSLPCLPRRSAGHRCARNRRRCRRHRHRWRSSGPTNSSGNRARSPSAPSRSSSSPRVWSSSASPSAERGLSLAALDGASTDHAVATHRTTECMHGRPIKHRTTIAPLAVRVVVAGWVHPRRGIGSAANWYRRPASRRVHR